MRSGPTEGAETPSAEPDVLSEARARLSGLSDPIAMLESIFAFSRAIEPLRQSAAAGRILAALPPLKCHFLWHRQARISGA